VDEKEKNECMKGMNLDRSPMIGNEAFGEVSPFLLFLSVITRPSVFDEHSQNPVTQAEICA
jgi:hypothetical protein